MVHSNNKKAFPKEASLKLGASNSLGYRPTLDSKFSSSNSGCHSASHSAGPSAGLSAGHLTRLI